MYLSELIFSASCDFSLDNKKICVEHVAQVNKLKRYSIKCIRER